MYRSITPRLLGKPRMERSSLNPPQTLLGEFGGALSVIQTHPQLIQCVQSCVLSSNGNINHIWLGCWNIHAQPSSPSFPAQMKNSARLFLSAPHTDGWIHRKREWKCFLFTAPILCSHCFYCLMMLPPLMLHSKSHSPSVTARSLKYTLKRRSGL